MLVGLGGKEAFYSPVIVRLSFKEPFVRGLWPSRMLLNSPSSALSERGRGKALEVGTSLPSDHLASGKTQVQLGFCKIASL